MLCFDILGGLLQLNHADDLAIFMKKKSPNFSMTCFQQSATIYFNENWFINHLSRSLLLRILQMEEWNRFFTSAPCIFQSFKNPIFEKKSLLPSFMLCTGKAVQILLKVVEEEKNGKYI